MRTTAVGAGAVAAGTVLHLLPGLATLRRFRCAFLPRLSGVGDPGHVALTFDDGPDPASTPAFLDLLDTLPNLAAAGAGGEDRPATGWKATFFLLGEQVARYPDLAAEVAARGHEIGAHGFHHANHLRHSAPWVTHDLRQAVDVIGEATGQAPTWFRPPYGALAASSVAAAHRVGLPVVLWTSWGRDWRTQSSAASVVADIERTWRPGPTVLLHDSDITSAPRSWQSALDALPELASRWEARGLRVGPLADHALPG